MHFDVFNGDADGIIALLQLRLAEPKQSQLITGVKRDIELLGNVPVEQASSVTVLDISLDKNTTALNTLLAENVAVFYVDHHRASNIPTADSLHSIIDTNPNTCTSLLVNHYLSGRYQYWAIAAAYGDNMLESADALAQSAGLSIQQKNQLKSLGIYINYNGYGRQVSDLHIAPDELFKQLLSYPNPFALIDEPGSVFEQLEQAYHDDMGKAAQSKVLHDDATLFVVLLEDAPWARRVSGVYGNELANTTPKRAHAVLTKNDAQSFTVSLRAPLANKIGADDICVQFPTGGGRAAAAGINELPIEMLGKFIEIVSNYYQ